MWRMFGIVLCACLVLLGCSGKKAAVEPQVVDEVTAEFKPIGPSGKLSHEEIAKGARDLCAAVRDSCAHMEEEARAKGDAAVQIAEETRAAHEERIAELEALDYDAMSDDEIYQYMEEISDLITAFREARDAIDAL